ncbi:MAG TPA: omptin family outer membrane protease [Spirochaetia bacterium]|nr:omptin family outer membrane protease [Spirochaetia bacterium]
MLFLLAGLGAPALLSAAPEPAAGSARPTLSVDAVAGALYGSAQEFVYANGYVLSELVWPLQPLFFAGSNATVSWPHGLVLGVSVRLGIPASVGSMTDSDYLNLFDSSGAFFPANTARTNLSVHDGFLNGSTTADAKIGWRVSEGLRASFQIYGGFKYMDYRWQANNGYRQYPPEWSQWGSNPFPPPGSLYTPWSASEPKTAVPGMVAIYEQTYTIPLAGIAFGYQLSTVFSLSGSVSFSPLASLNDIDQHLLRQLVFYDSVDSCLYVEPEVDITARVSDHFLIALGLTYLQITSPKDGNTIELDTTTNMTRPYAGSGGWGAGGGIQTYGATLTFRVSF